MGYKKIIIFGDDTETSIGDTEKNAFIYIHGDIFRSGLEKKADHLIIGRGRSKVRESDLLNIDVNKVNEETIFHIYAHGNIDSNGEHQIDLFSPSDSTRDVIKVIAQIVRDPVMVHIDSCFGGAAVKYVDELPVGSVIIGHGPEDGFSFGNTLYATV